MLRKVGELSEGQSFGELALINNRPRAARITCMTPCHFGTLDRRSFQIIKNNHRKNLEAKIEILNSVPNFKGISSVALMKYSNYFKPKDFTKG